MYKKNTSYLKSMYYKTIHNSVAIEFLKSLADRHKEVLDKVQKH